MYIYTYLALAFPLLGDTTYVDGTPCQTMCRLCSCAGVWACVWTCVCPDVCPCVAAGCCRIAFPGSLPQPRVAVDTFGCVPGTTEAMTSTFVHVVWG